MPSDLSTIPQLPCNNPFPLTWLSPPTPPHLLSLSLMSPAAVWPHPHIHLLTCFLFPLLSLEYWSSFTWAQPHHHASLTLLPRQHQPVSHVHKSLKSSYRELWERLHFNFGRSDVQACLIHRNRFMCVWERVKPQEASKYLWPHFKSLWQLRNKSSKERASTAVT